MKDWATGLGGRVADNVIASLIAAAILGLVAAGWATGTFQDIVSGDASLPAWALVVGVLGVFIVGGTAGFWINRRREADPAAMVAAQFWKESQLHAEYAEHISLTLDQLQAVISGGIPGVSIEQFIERGILYPGRDMLMSNQPQGADVRISILMPDGPEFVMTYSAGHSSEGHARFRMSIAESFSRHAYEQGTMVVSYDVDSDNRFQAHPRATRPYGSMVSAPLRAGGHTAGVFNVVFTEPEGFDVADYTYVVLLAAITNVALAASGGMRPVRTTEPVQSGVSQAQEDQHGDE